MSKRTLTAVLLLLLMAIHTALVAQQPARKSSLPKADAETVKAKAAEVVAAASEILEEVSKLRGLTPLSPVKSGLKSRSEIEQEIIRGFEETSTPEEIDAANKSLIAYGLAPKDFRYREFMVN